ncbi:MAG: hypothetical protein ACTHJM_13175 [Marmoricola sp.]
MTRIARRVGILLSLTMAATFAVTSVTVASSSGATPTIGPGVQMNTVNAQCTANFVFRRVVTTYKTVNGSRVAVKTTHTYVGYAAHCASKGSDTQTNGCHTPSYPLGTKVQFVVGESGGSLGGLVGGSPGTVIGTGTLRYSSWIAMQRAHTTSSLACNFNDLALVEVDRAYLRRVNPTVPYFGGPTKLAALPGAGQAVYTVGSSSQRGTTRSTSGKVVDASNAPWSDIVKTKSGGVPGDSGSGYMNSAGDAVGVLSTLNVSLLPPSSANGIGSLAQEVAFARKHGLSGLALVPGRTAFNPAAAGQSSGGGNLLGGLPIL